MKSNCTITTETTVCAVVCREPIPPLVADYNLSGTTLVVDYDGEIQWELTLNGVVVWDFGWGLPDEPMGYTIRGMFNLGVNNSLIYAYIGELPLMWSGETLGIRLTIKDIYNQTSSITKIYI